MWFSCAVRVLDTDGAVNVTDNGISLTDATEATLALCARSSYNGYDASPNRSGKDEQMLLEDKPAKARKPQPKSKYKEDSSSEDERYEDHGEDEEED